MTTTPSAARILAALDQRLKAAADVALATPSPTEVHATRAGDNLARLITECHRTRRADLAWLVLTVVRAAYPTTDDVREFLRHLDLAPQNLESWLLEDVIAHPHRARPDRQVRLVTDRVVVDVDFCARHETHTGIQRVVRETVRRWYDWHSALPTAWAEGGCLRELTVDETARVLAGSWTDHGDVAAERAPSDTALVVPWHTVVVLPDVPNGHVVDPLAALARFSASTVSIVGYDMIPVTNADQRPAVDAETFTQYLTVVKHAHRVAAISDSAAAEFAGFQHMLAAQGLPGPDVTTVHLTIDAPPAATATTTARANHPRPVVLCPGTKEPHKNQRAALHAAERLWREGLDFELRLMGGPGWSEAVLRPALERLQRAGRPVVDLGRVSEERLWAEYRDADVAVFISLHEGYGLPAAEALACGTPVLTSCFGSLAEIARPGGCLTVDPRDDDDVADGLRRLLSEPDLLATLREQAARRSSRTWDDYATELWTALAGPLGAVKPDSTVVADEDLRTEASTS